MSRKHYYDLEKIIKGVANHRRIEILFILKKTPGLSTDNIVQQLNINYQTGAAHVQKLMQSGLIIGHRQGNIVSHELTPAGKAVIKLLIII